MPVLRLQPAVWLPSNSITMHRDYMYCGPGEGVRRVKVIGYRRDGTKEQYLCRDVKADGTVIQGEDARIVWLDPWFKPLGYAPIDWQRYTRMKLKLRFPAEG